MRSHSFVGGPFAVLADKKEDKYGMPWLTGPHSTTPALDKSSDPCGSDAAFNTMCRVWGYDPSSATPDDVHVTQLQFAIVASTVRHVGSVVGCSARAKRVTHRCVRLLLSLSPLP